MASPLTWFVLCKARVLRLPVMLAIRRALFHAAERSGIKPEITPPAWIKNGWRWHLVCQKPICQAAAPLERRKK
ncbi:hypothetical protein NK6_7220 [Bradyrhizobium diazoefficiens]|uniref:Uncharacterized protein n=1 Tax=Bradyrhizobium diazoefficiens TaxID=1355477 RepID=A0A0E4BTH5_9BRAD|nr:hypothetical protein NK6_7220 [Bradyrhizobium diazoefficiens]